MIEHVHGFDWNEGNLDKCQQHGISIDEIEALFSGVIHVFPDPRHSQSEIRHLAIGMAANGRHIFLAFTLRHTGPRRLIRPISARYMHVKEVKHYEEQIAKARQ